MTYDLIIVGAGPAGMAAAVAASKTGLSVAVMDDQAAPGGQIWRNIETLAGSPLADILGEAYQAGIPAVAAFRASATDYLPRAQVWHCEEYDEGYRLFYTIDGQAKSATARYVLLATGAQERPAPFEGWTLPGVMNLGAAQVVLKSSAQIPSGELWIAGSGPLVLLYLVQLLESGGRVAGVIDTAPKMNILATAGHVLRALPKIEKLLKGLSWQRYLARKGVKLIPGHLIRAEGEGALQALRYRDRNGAEHQVKADRLLIHQGVLPSIHIPLSLRCDMEWHEAGQYFMPRLDEVGATSLPGLYVAGDGAGIAGAEAAVARGTIAGLAIAQRTGKIDVSAMSELAMAAKAALKAELSLRPLLDGLYAPHPSIFAPSDDTIVCRCEEVTAGEIRALARNGDPDPNQMKAFTRCGMGPCQGRQCGYSVSNILAQEQNRRVADVGFYRIRPPLKPVTLAELAYLDDEK